MAAKKASELAWEEAEREKSQAELDKSLEKLGEILRQQDELEEADKRH